MNKWQKSYTLSDNAGRIQEVMQIFGKRTTTGKSDRRAFRTLTRILSGHVALNKYK